ncbi:23S rRNA pseudouridine(2604) synthase RluF [Marinomonas mediterranea]|jgi:ribosomal large subunit pseudouridine synthase F (EC 5.4.99.-)|uniref:Pseudouridine synthase n=1 Tax=Marinomonas mediterranea (strain ATCC 700492 / JCM 21426 / NBRC 103028 / MMB-1) TaxID=717774 RepID=F2K060_MARM1|nr:23S rRNA pseudouridine(2604) synthase RluF [Marinomonas mediterranea]ADZ93274.1 pseudouridine synthase Rsu [Marinomonas mediterranea MMB-1]WCN11161.1 23S rRNA pseudouridine(2604) synthase RluF [Marinomonas mediterranea]WCN15224.1 23S rRNA pseudouridine(2604) synthase RluF [Marinomonas mediterranea]WCN19269.1 23S rRNA pseudouridine(2604) synthase RluF [Marinomonas mediterranea MMB-1]
MNFKTSIRINKYISESGLCSRREADRFIDQGSVFINGKRAGTGDQVSPGDLVKVNGQIIEPQEAEDLIFIALNKPVGIVSTTESSEPANIVSFVKHGARIFPIGRLDKDSQGLIFLTNNGDLVNKILRAANNHEKEYLVTVNKPITQAFIDGMSGGVPILGQVTKKCKVVKESTYVFNITLVQGLNRQIRRMAEHFGYEVTRLERIRIMNVSLKGLALGDWRDLTQKELQTLVKLTEDSDTTNPPAKNPRKPKPQGNRHSGNRESGNRRSDTRDGKNNGGARRGGRPSAPGKGKPGSSKPSNSKPGSSRPGSSKPPHSKGNGKPAPKGKTGTGGKGRAPAGRSAPKPAGKRKPSR